MIRVKVIGHCGSVKSFSDNRIVIQHKPTQLAQMYPNWHLAKLALLLLVKQFTPDLLEADKTTKMAANI